jgi:hypothetical protein
MFKHQTVRLVVLKSNLKFNHLYFLIKNGCFERKTHLIIFDSKKVFLKQTKKVKYFVVLPQTGHDHLLELRLLEKSARHDFIIAQQRSNNNIISCQLLESS